MALTAFGITSSDYSENPDIVVRASRAVTYVENMGGQAVLLPTSLIRSLVSEIRSLRSAGMDKHTDNYVRNMSDDFGEIYGNGFDW